MNDCQPGAFCPDHPVDPGLLVLIAVTLIAIALVAVTLIALLALVDAAARRIHHRLTRTRRNTAAAAAARRPHLDVMAAAVEDWWLTTDPAQDRDTGAEVAAHVDMYLHSSGYRITPWPHTPGPSRARLRLRAR
ncbi:hypothetical protein ACFWM5_00505 [Streptomyces bobili]|uniref:hypothetical protein n=1 Tax=Streptomyces bobili TaxID=67280 RepID=UPI003666F982